jgi:hypothetical protein
MRRGIALLFAGLLIVALGAAPAADAKKKNVSGTLLVSVPGFDQNTHTSLATGFIRAKSGCAKARTVRFALFNSDGTPVQAGQPTVVTAPDGSFIAAIPEPFNPNPNPATVIIKVAVDGLVTKKKGKKVNCLPLIGPDSALTVPGN